MSTNALFESEVIDDDILTVKLRGNLDSISTPEFENALNEHLAQGHSKIIIDCRLLGYISSLGIGALVALQTRLRRKGGEMKLAAVQGPVMQVIRAVRLDKVFDMHGDLEFARQSFGESE